MQHIRAIVVTTVLVTYSLNGQGYDNNTLLEYTYIDPPIVTKIDPVRGALNGNTPILVNGQNFLFDHNSTKCHE